MLVKSFYAEIYIEHHIQKNWLNCMINAVSRDSHIIFFSLEMVIANSGLLLTYTGKNLIFSSL